MQTKRRVSFGGDQSLVEAHILYPKKIKERITFMLSPHAQWERQKNGLKN